MNSSFSEILLDEISQQQEPQSDLYWDFEEAIVIDEAPTHDRLKSPQDGYYDTAQNNQNLHDSCSNSSEEALRKSPSTTSPHLPETIHSPSIGDGKSAGLEEEEPHEEAAIYGES